MGLTNEAIDAAVIRVSEILKLWNKAVLRNCIGRVQRFNEDD